MIGEPAHGTGPDHQQGAAPASIPVVLMRGGTSKGVFVGRDALPPPGPERDEVILDLMGSPDPMQIDGLGGSHVTTSKVMVIAKSQLADTDVEYTAVQVGTDSGVVDYSGNCGNLSAAVGAYSVDEGLLTPEEPVTVVRMLNLNARARILAHVPVRNGRAAHEGDCTIDGVPGKGAPILLEFLEPGGSVFGRVLPSGRVRDRVDTSTGGFEVSIVDVSHPTVFVAASALGIAGDELAGDLNRNAALVALLEEVRGASAVLLGVAERAGVAATASPVVPRVAIVAPPPPSGDTQITGRTVAMGRVIPSYALTVALCTAAACRIPGTIPHSLATPSDEGEVRIAHPSGVISAEIVLEGGVDAEPHIVSASILRTARRLMAGSAFLKHPPGSARPSSGQDGGG